MISSLHYRKGTEAGSRVKPEFTFKAPHSPALQTQGGFTALNLRFLP